MEREGEGFGNILLQIHDNQFSSDAQNGSCAIGDSDNMVKEGDAG